MTSLTEEEKLEFGRKSSPSKPYTREDIIGVEEEEKFLNQPSHQNIEHQNIEHQWNCHYESVQKQGFIQQSSRDCRCNSDNIEHCGCIQRMLMIFSYLEHCEVDVTIYDGLFHIFYGFSMEYLLNDIDHILTYHNKEIHNRLFIKKIRFCDGNHCRLYSRTYKSEMLSFNEMDRVRMEFIAEAHSYLFHSIPNLSDKDDDYKSMEDIIQQYTRYHPDRCNRYGMNDTALTYQYEQNRSDINNMRTSSVSSIDTNDEEKHELSLSDDLSVDPTDVHHVKKTEKLFSYGHRFEYVRWRGGRRNPYYVGCKWKDLKRELLAPDKQFSVEDWNILIISSNKRAKTTHSKTFKSSKRIDGKRKIISLSRIVAVSLWCNNGTLASKLKRTFLKVSSDKDTALVYKQAKGEHSKYAHWAQLLVTTVDQFGKNAKETNYFYRGLSDKYIFKGFHCHLLGPISTSVRIAIGVKFGAIGITLQLQTPDWSKNTTYFDCRYYSCYKEEQELLFFGYDNYFNVIKVCKAIKITSADDTRSVLILQALTTIIKNNVAGLLKLDSNQNVIKTLDLLLRKNSMDDTISDNYIYLYETVQHFLQSRSRRKVYLRLKVIQQIMKWIKGKKSKTDEYIMDFERLSSHFFEDSNLIYDKKIIHIDITKIAQLFVKCEEITYDFNEWNGKLSEDNKTWRNLLEFMNETKTDGQRVRVRKIVIKNVASNRFPTQTFLKKMANKITGSRWNIYERIRQSQEMKKTLLFLYGSCDILEGYRIICQSSKRKFIKSSTKRWKNAVNKKVNSFKNKIKK